VQFKFSISKGSQREFDRTLKSYLAVNGRTLPEALNEKSYFIAGKAIRNTHKADVNQIRASLGAEMKSVVGKRGKALKKKKIGFTDKYSNSVAVAIVVAGLRKAGEAIPSAEKLAELGLALIRRRLKTVTFIRSGWLPSLRRLARFSKYGRLKFDDAKQYGQPKGGTSPATASQGDYAKVSIWNSAGGESKHKQALLRYGAPGLEAAVNEETASMKQYLEKKLRQNAQAVGIRTN
jgi:hypothetical protein